VIGNFAGSGIHVEKTNFITIQDCFIGTNRDGTHFNSNLGDGINLFDTCDSMIGGLRGDGNLISGNSNGIVLSGDGSIGNVIKGNLIGTDRFLEKSLGNTFNGIEIRLGASENIVGVDDSSTGFNVIAGNGDSASLDGGYGVRLTGSDTQKNTITQNLIGYFNPPGGGFMEISNLRGGVIIDESATLNTILENTIRFNGGHGVTVISGTKNFISENTIRFNGGDGVTVISGTKNSIRKNAIDSNGPSVQDIPIDLGNDGATPNDIGDDDKGPNDLLNHPDIISADILYLYDNEGTGSTQRSMIIRGRLEVHSDKDYRMDIFAREKSGLNATKYVGSTVLPVTSEVPLRFDIIFPSHDVEIGSQITTTITDLDGNTSEVSHPVDLIQANFVPGRVDILFDGVNRWKGTLEPTDLINLIADWKAAGDSN